MRHRSSGPPPQVGKAWLYLSKAYQNYGAGGDAGDAKEKSEAALFRYVPDHARTAPLQNGVTASTPSCENLSTRGQNHLYSCG